MPIRRASNTTPPTRSRPSRPRYHAAYRALPAILILFASTPAHAQIPAVTATNATYLDDSTRANETLQQIDELVRAGSLHQAARTLQTILTLEGDRLLPAPSDPDLFLPVRDAVHRALLDRPALLDAYREQQQPAAQTDLDAGHAATVFATRFLTDAGLEATLRLAQQHLEAARFDAAWRTLRQIESHPRFDTARAPAAELATTIAAYQRAVTTPDPAEQTALPAAQAAARWLAAPPAASPSITPPPGLTDGIRPPVVTTPPTGPSPDLDGIVPTPLAAADLPIAHPWAAQPDRSAPSRRLYWAFPAILDNLTIINDGDAITAFDRFTLRQRWQYPQGRVPPPGNRGDADRSRGRTRLIEDPATITAHRDLIIAPMGNVINGRREGESTIVALDRDTGRVVWSVRPDLLAPELETATVRGPVTVYADTALVMFRRNERSRRTITTSIAALDLADGSLRWHRFLGAVGALPYQQQTRSPQAVTVVGSVAYLTDEIGLIAAIDATSGNPVWIRRLPALSADDNQNRPWAIHAPVALPGNRVALVNPDRTALLAINRDTGAIEQSRPTPTQGVHTYLLPLPNTLAVADPTRITFLDPTNLNTTAAQPFVIPGSRAPAVGRVVATADNLFIPVESGVLRVRQGDNAIAFIPLDHAGNIDLADGQLLAADDTRLRTYLAWETAAEILNARAEAEPSNPEHTVSFAELAYRAGRTEQIVPAIDRAITAIRESRDQSPQTQTANAFNRRLFDSVLEIVNEAHNEREALEQARTPAANTPAAITEPGTLPPLSAQQTAELINRLDRLANTPAQRVAHLLAEGRQAEQTARPADSARTYQRILADEVLSATPWRGQRLNIRAQIEATRRLIRVAEKNGPGIYQPYAAEADAKLAALEASPTLQDPDAYEQLAREYPIATAAARGRIAQAKSLRAAGLDRDALIAGNGALESVRRLERAGVPIDDQLLGRAFGLQIAALADASRIEEAASLLAEFNETHAGLLLRDDQGPVDADSLFDTITSRLAARRTGPRLGPDVLPEPEPQLIQGYPLRPLARPEPRGVARARYDGTLIVAKQGGTLAWHAPAEDGTLGPVWTREIDRDPLLLRTDEVSAWIFWPDQTGGWLERTDLADGKPLWTSRAWADLVDQIEVDADDQNAARLDAADRFLDPLAGRVRGSEILIATGARTLVFIERAGRAVALDAATGRELWARYLPITQVHDADLAAGVLALVGEGPDAEGNPGPALLTLDPRSGENINTDDQLQSPPRWVRVTESGDVVAGLRERVISYSPFNAGLNWEISNEPLFETREAWLNGATLLVRADDDALWQIDTASGRLADTPLETRGRIDTTDRIVVRKTPTRLILAAADGVCVFANDGELKGLDAFSQPARLLPAVVAEDTIAVLKIERGRFGIGGTRFAINLLTHESARIAQETVVRLFGDPTDMQGIDGRLLINAGDLTAVVRLPIEESDQSNASTRDKPSAETP